ncbi:MAG: ABC transporter ATP-binding protein, partial [Verrucomicrobiota bacterium]
EENLPDSLELTQKKTKREGSDDESLGVRPTLSCRNLTRFLGQEESRIQVLKGVNLDLHEGLVYSIVGPSGCGKSTMLYLLGLLDTPDEGAIKITGVEANNLTDAEATQMRNEHLGFVFQFHFLIKEFTALENILLPMRKLDKIPQNEMKERAMHLLEGVGLAEKAFRRTNHLSGGEQQRVAIARALANSPKVILADEPTGNLDTKNSDRVFSLMSDIVHNEKLTLLTVTHNPQIADTSDYVLEMADGQFVSELPHPPIHM